MKKINIFNVLLIGLTLGSILYSQEEQMSKEQKAWMEYMTPGDAHSILASHTGEWKTKTTFWMQPGAEPTVSEGTSTNEMIMGGRYLVSKPKGTTFGMPFEGMSLEGFDNATKEFTSVWIDNLGTGITVAKGKYDEDNKVINYKGTMIDPISKKEISFRETISFSEENVHVIEMFIIQAGKEFKNMEVVFTKITK